MKKRNVIRLAVYVVLLAVVAISEVLWQRANGAVGCTQSELAQVTDAYFAQAVSAMTGEEKIVCLTFDDGPSKNTQPILDILKEQNIQATFFVIAADNNEQYLHLVKQEAADGHQVALHSATHEYKQIYANVDAYWEDIETLKEKLKPYIQVDGIQCLRFPGGSTNTVSRKYGGRTIMNDLKSQAEEKHYRWIDWNVCAGDAVGGHPSAATILNNVKRDAKGKNICVVLMHDTAVTGTTVEALPDIINWFREQGYTFCTVDQMFDRTE